MLEESTYKNIAENCSAYCCKSNCRCTNKAGDHEISCTTCKHFTQSSRCDLDLINPIMNNHDF